MKTKMFHDIPRSWRSIFFFYGEDAVECEFQGMLKNIFKMEFSLF